MKRPVSHKLLPCLLALNAVLVGLVLLVVLDRSPGILPAAFAQVSPTTGSASSDLEVIPAQMSSNTWGCYIIDKKRGTICAYQYIPGERMLKFQAARAISQDFGLGNFNTSPSPAEVGELVNKEQKGLTGEKPASGSDSPR